MVFKKLRPLTKKFIKLFENFLKKNEVAALFLPKNYTFLEFFSLLFYVIVTVENAFQNLCVLLLNNKRIPKS